RQGGRSRRDPGRRAKPAHTAGHARVDLPSFLIPAAVLSVAREQSAYAGHRVARTGRAFARERWVAIRARPQSGHAPGRARRHSPGLKDRSPTTVNNVETARVK